MIEATVKEYVVDDDGQVWLWPRSSHPEYQQPFLLKERIDRDMGSEANSTETDNRYREVYADDFEIVALVIGSYRRE